MKKSHKVLLALLGVIVLAVAGFKAMRPKEPEYQGRKLSEWIADLNGPQPKALEAEKVIKEIPELMLPFVEQRILQNREPSAVSARERFLLGIRDEIFGKRYSKAYQWAADFEVLRILGTNSLPVLERLFYRPDIHSTAADVLANMDAIEILAKGTSTNQPFSIRWNAIYALGHVSGRKTEATDILIPWLQDTNESIAIITLDSLGELHCRPKIVVPLLCKYLGTNGSPATLTAVIAISRYGTNAAIAITDLKKLKSLSDITVRDEIDATLKQIEAAQNP